MIQGLQRVTWTGVTVNLGDAWRLEKGTRIVHCRLVTHPIGWELRLDVDGELLRSHAFRDPDALIAAATEWRRAFHEKGWS